MENLQLIPMKMFYIHKEADGKVCLVAIDVSSIDDVKVSP